MKIVIVTLLLCVAVALADLTEEQKEMLKPYKDACLAEVKIDQEDIDKAKKEFQEEKKTEFGEKIGCFAACMFKKIGFMSEDGKFDEDMVRALGAEQLPEAVVEKAIAACKNQVGENDCETASKLFSCFLQQGIAVSS